ncbi:MAG: GNAT family N-acetyltransferase [Bacteroidaceae bacterium]|nr:GNAT family N-acetyltransferase [Bacteroidaceae bacterium]
MQDFSLFDQCVMLPYNHAVRERCLSYTCGDTDLDDFFLNDAERYAKELMGKTYCWITEEKPHRIVALFTLANDSIKTLHLDKTTRNRLNRPIDNPKRGRSYPATLIGRIGVNQAFQGMSIGTQLIQFIKDWFRHEDNKTGCRFLVVDAYNNPRTLRFYEQNGFRYLHGDETEECAYYNIPSEDKIATRLMYFDLKKV